MSKYILTYQGFGPTPSELESRIGNSVDLKLVDRFGENLVIEGKRNATMLFLRDIHGWFCAPERRVGPPRVNVLR